MANIEFKTLAQFMPYWCQKILPAVYDDSLSYYQLLGRILQKYNEVIEIVNKHSETLIDHENRITAAEAQIKLNRQAIEALKAELAKLDEQVKQNTANIAALTERVNGHDEDIEQINTWITNASTFLLVNHRAIINPSTHDMKLQLFNTMFPQWTDWYNVIINGGDSWTIMSGTSSSDKAIGVLSLTPGQAGQFTAFGAMVEDNDLHYFTATYSRQGSAANLGGTDNWKEVELLDITNIKQSLGGGEYDTISQKVLTQLINSKLNHDMGITGATAGQYINIATVDGDGKPVTYGFGTPGGGGSGVDIVQTTGQSTTSVMSQNATTVAINAVNTTAEAGKTAANMLAATVVYPTTASGTNGKFVGKDGTTLTRAQLLAALIGADGKNTVFTVKKTGATSWDRITWFKASAGEGLYDFAWYETDGTNAKAGVDRLTMATNGQFAVSEQSSVNVPVSGVVEYTDFGSAFFNSNGTTPAPINLSGSAGQTQNTTCYLKLPFECNSVEEAYAYLDGLGGLKCHLQLVAVSTDVDVYYGIIFKPFKQTSVRSGSEYTPNYTLCGFAPYNVLSKNQSVRLAFVMQEVYSTNKTLIRGTMRALIVSGV